LRTPLTVISGYVESMRDGVLAPTTERFDLIYNEIGRLQNMVTDLRMLSQADSGELRLNLVSVEPAGILQHTAEIFLHHA
jgi:two-component system OmpR family sensor kinase/two-component system sensor histidine kinase BaeS